MCNTETDGTIKLFDFDGVLASPFEEALYQMPVSARDSEFIDKAAARYGLGAGHLTESVSSFRYMCMQAVMDDLGHPIREGPLLDKAEGPFMVITARSDFFALRRMFRFLEWYGKMPLYIFTLGKTPKFRVVERLLIQYPNASFEFYDDLLKHVEPVEALGSDRVTTFHVDNDMGPVYEKAQSYFNSQIVGHVS